MIDSIAQLQAIVADQPYPLLFATISGAHLYGFASPDSDYDLRGVHILPMREVAGLYETRETIEVNQVEDGMELDLVSHDAARFFGLMLKRNGYVLEQLWSPLVVHTSPQHDELKSVSIGCITRYHAHHYLGFARTEWQLFIRAAAPQVKPLLYVYRVLLTGIHLMQTGQIECNLSVLNQQAGLAFIDELIAMKSSTAEHVALTDVDIERHQREYERLVAELEQARDDSHLPDTASCRPALNDLLLRVRGLDST